MKPLRTVCLPALLRALLPVAAGVLLALPARADGPAPTAARAAAVPAEVDALDRLRERLAEKLGASKAPDGPNANVLRVASKSTAAPVVVRRGTPMKVVEKGDAEALHWDYQGGAGPQAWGGLRPEFSLCGSGKRQSPIDIHDGIAVDLEPVQFDYRASGFGVIDNGHTVQVNVAPGNFMQVGGRRWELVQFHFHRPSEERVEGRQFDMVAHLVHKDADGRLAVVAVLLERGSAQPVVQAVWNNLPLEKNEEAPARAPIDLNHLLPADRRYFTYMGSLTTPPCSEGVLWIVMQQPVQLAPSQIDIFARLYPMNARPLQQASGRLIKQSN
jgi:carbonic anhydrase